MNTEPATATFMVSEPFDRALKVIREALAKNDVHVCAEFDASARVKKELNIGFTPCRILLVDYPTLLLEAATLDCSAAVLFPFHVVVSGRGSRTLVHWLNPIAIEGARLPTGASAPLAKLQSLVTRSLETIGMRQEIFQAMPSHAK
jgi:uncharacterized protein (DUF302 family)